VFTISTSAMKVAQAATVAGVGKLMVEIEAEVVVSGRQSDISRAGMG
jgi:hypothetical protein